MKNKLLFIIFFLFLIIQVLISFRCENKSCHHEIVFYNYSTDTVIFSLKYYYNDKCLLSKRQVAPNDSTELSIRDCWEDVFSNENFPYTQEIFILSNENLYSKPFECDSLFNKFNVLKYFNLSLQDLQKTNWKIYYP